MPKKWNTMKAAGIGAVFGVAYQTALILTGQKIDPSGAELVGLMVGSAAGGAFLFAMVSGMRNLMVGAK